MSLRSLSMLHFDSDDMQVFYVNPWIAVFFSDLIEMVRIFREPKSILAIRLHI